MQAAFAIYYLFIVSISSTPQVLPIFISNTRYVSLDQCKAALPERTENAWRVARDQYGDDVVVDVKCDEAPSEPT